MAVNDSDLPRWREPLPSKLFHYTDAAGLMGIVKDRSIRGTHHRFLNDHGEIRFGVSIVTDVVKAMSRDLGEQVASQICNWVEHMSTGSFFVSCFSEDNQILSQWREYARKGAGYCLAMSTNSVLNVDLRSSVVTDAVNCIYGRGDLERAAKEWFAYDMAVYKEDVVERLQDSAFRLALAAKNHHFREEREWRLLTVTTDPSKVEHRPGADRIVPYVSLRGIDISEVWIGPRVGPDPASAQATVAHVLATNGFGKANTFHWDCPMAS